MNEYRLRHRADVTRKASTSLNTDGERVLTDSTVYTDVPCLIQSRTATPVEIERYSASVNMYNLYVRQSADLQPNDRVEVTHPNGVSVMGGGEYEVVAFRKGERYSMAVLREIV